MLITSTMTAFSDDHARHLVRAISGRLDESSAGDQASNKARIAGSTKFNNLVRDGGSFAMSLGVGLPKAKSCSPSIARICEWHRIPKSSPLSLSTAERFSIPSLKQGMTAVGGSDIALRIGSDQGHAPCRGWIEAGLGWTACEPASASGSQQTPI